MTSIWFSVLFSIYSDIGKQLGSPFQPNEKNTFLDEQK